MNDQQFINVYVKILNETLGEAFNKNLVLQAQLEVSKQLGNRTAELEAKIAELTNLSTNNNALLVEVESLKTQLNQANLYLSNKNNHIESFKRELGEARAQLKTALTNNNAEFEALLSKHKTEIELLNLKNNAKVESLNEQIELLTKENEELKSRKKKNGKALNTLETSVFISDNSTF